MRKHTRRKTYPKVDPIKVAMAHAAITTGADLDRMRTAQLTAVAAFRNGRATEADWREIADMANVTETMVRMGIGPEAMAVCERVQIALGEAVEQRHARGRIEMSAEALIDLRDLYEYHDLQRASVAHGVYQRAIARTAARIRSAAPDVKVYA